MRIQIHFSAQSNPNYKATGIKVNLLQLKQTLNSNIQPVRIRLAPLQYECVSQLPAGTYMG